MHPKWTRSWAGLDPATGSDPEQGEVNLIVGTICAQGGSDHGFHGVLVTVAWFLCCFVDSCMVFMLFC